MIPTASADDGMQLYVHDDEYYWDFLTFVIGSHLFRVPKRAFVEGSETFCKDHNIESDAFGDDDAGNIRIPLDVKVVDFQCFLKALYPRARDGSVDLSREGWISVLKLSTNWFFNDLRGMAINKITTFSMTAIERICLAKEYNISPMLLSGYFTIVNENRLISVQEAAQMDCEKVTAIGLYEIIVRRLTGSSSGTIEDVIEEVFSDELKRMRLAENRYLTFEEREEIAAEEARVAAEKVRVEEEEKRAEEAKAKEEQARLKELQGERNKRLKQKEARLLREEERLKAQKESLEAEKVFQARSIPEATTTEPTPPPGPSVLVQAAFNEPAEDNQPPAGASGGFIDQDVWVTPATKGKKEKKEKKEKKKKKGKSLDPGPVADSNSAEKNGDNNESFVDIS